MPELTRLDLDYFGELELAKWLDMPPEMLRGKNLTPWRTTLWKNIEDQRRRGVG
jgi:hypothetical protein